jgi:hypothetical protein
MNCCDGKDTRKVKALIEQMMLEKLQLAKIPDDAKPSLELMKTMFVSILEVCLVELDNQREPDCGITEKQTGIR